MLQILSLVLLVVCVPTLGTYVIHPETCDVSNLIAIVQVFRHGQRTPVFFYPDDPYSDPSYWSDLATGQLTNFGKQQQYELGQFTKKRYTHFLPQRYNNQDFHAQTTDVDRTHMSAQTNIAAMFPPAGTDIWNPHLLWQPVPVHPSDSNVISGSPDCAIYTAESANVVVNAPEFVNYNTEYADLYTYLTKHTGYNVTNVEGVYGIYDTLMIEHQVGLELPRWTDSVFPDPLRALTGYAFKSFTYTDTQKRLMTGRWLYELVKYFNNIFADNSSSQKYQIYSAHDTNIAAILNTLGAFRPHYPSFASTIYFELRNKSNNAVVNIWHRNDGIFEPITIKNCEFDCSLTDFQAVLSPWLVDSDEWSTECALNVTDLTDLSTIKTTPELAEVHAQFIEHFNFRRPHNSKLKH